MRRWLAICLAMTAVRSVAQLPDSAAVKVLVRQVQIAQQNYEAAKLSTLIDARYVEVSPAGEVDEHDRFLGFYAPSKRTEFPPMTVSEELIRVFGDTAVDIQKIGYTVTVPDGTTRALEIRATYTARREGMVWKLIGAQFTSVRTAPAAK